MSLTTLRELCIGMQIYQERKTTLEEQLKSINSDLDELRLRKIPDLMEQLEVKTATFEGVGRVQLANDIYASTREGQKEAAITWLRDLGYDGMVTEGYNASSLKALFRRMLEEATPIPDDLFSVTPFTRASIVKA